MGERFKRKVTKAFEHGSDAAYAERLETSDLLSACRSEIVSQDYIVFADETPRPDIGTEVMLIDRNGEVSAVKGNQFSGTVENADEANLSAAIKEVGGILRATVTRHARIGNSYTVSVQVDVSV